MSDAVCVKCSHKIDATAKVCPYCGAKAEAGRRPLPREESQPREPRTGAKIIEFARHRQSIVILAVAVIAILVLGALHRFVTIRNATSVSAKPPVPLTEVTDLSSRDKESQPPPMPALKFQYSGNPAAMRTPIVEAGAVTPPEVVAAQQAAAQKGNPKPATETAVPDPPARPPAATPAPDRRTPGTAH